MCSSLPKVLHRLAGKPLLAHVVEKAIALNPEKIIVVHSKGDVDAFKQALSAEVLTRPAVWVEQAKPLGTGDAVKQALLTFSEHDLNQDTLILLGDVPLLPISDLQALLKRDVNEAQIATASCVLPATAASVGILNARLHDPKGFGRIIRDEKNRIIGIVEEKEASDQQRQIQEIFTGTLYCPLQNACSSFQQNCRWSPLGAHVSSPEDRKKDPH